MRNAYAKDILRTISKNAKRFVAILAITALGLTAFLGITAACRDLYLAADAFYDEQRLFDIRVLSTLGLTDEDVEELQQVTGVETADSAYSETVHTTVKGTRQSVDLVMLSEKGLNRPYLVEGAMPQSAGEVAVTQKYLDEAGLAIGDRLDIEEDLDDAEEEPEPGEAPADEPTAGAAEGEAAGDDTAAEEDDGPNTDIDWDAEVEIEEEAETPNFLSTRYTITGVVIDPMDVANKEGTAAFRSTATTDYTFFITPADVDTEVYSAVYLTLEGLAALDCYAAPYEKAVQEAITRIEEQIMEQREKARYDAVMDEALTKIGDAETTMDEKFTEADGQFADAWAEIEDAKQELADGEAELTREERDALQKLADARAQLEDGKAQLRSGEEELNKGEAELEANVETAEKRLAKEQAKLNASREQLSPGIDQLKAALAGQWPEAEWAAFVEGVAAAAAKLILADPNAAADPQTAATAAAAAAEQQTAFTDALAMAAMGAGYPPGDIPQLAADSVTAGVSLGMVEGGQKALNSQKKAFNKEIEKARQDIADGRRQIADGWGALAAGEAELDEEEAKALRELADAWRELDEGRQELADGEAELIENQQKYADKKDEAQEKLADAYTELEDIDMAQWYVQDRTSIDSYSSLDSDVSSIAAIGQAFPVLFLVVAVLISLTTMTRMVEEERGLIGTYKALGFGDLAIARKYILYALLASAAGGVVGALLGFIALPKILIGILGAIYIVPGVGLHFDVVSGVAGALLFLASNVIATALACRGELKRTPAALMRPKAPRAGARILLEYIPPVWNRMKFLNKVTARNLFRYKKRLFMTVIGIAGCTALVLAGFAIRDSVTDLVPKQYEHIYRYDLMAMTDAEDLEGLSRHLAADGDVAETLTAQVEGVKVLNAAGASESMQITVVPAGAPLADFIYTPDLDGNYVALEDTGVLITQNAADLLGVAASDTVTLQSLQLDRYTATVSGVVENYLGNCVYISQSLYQGLFGPYEPNAVYVRFAGTGVDAAAYADRLLDEDLATSTASTEGMKAQFTTDFAILNYVIYILIVLAAGLAFVVLFTLSNTNISERVRELATIKVLGFFDREVHAYANKETLILTLIGVLCGLPLGYVLSGLLLATLKMPSIQFALVIEPLSYLLAGVISFSFALVVNLITNRILDKINMVESLKSVE